MDGNGAAARSPAIEEVAVDSLSVTSVIFLVLLILRLPSQLNFDSHHVSTPAIRIKDLVKTVALAVVKV